MDHWTILCSAHHWPHPSKTACSKGHLNQGSCLTVSYTNGRCEFLVCGLTKGATSYRCHLSKNKIVLLRQASAVWSKRYQTSYSQRPAVKPSIIILPVISVYLHLLWFKHNKYLFLHHTTTSADNVLSSHDS